MGLQLTSWVAIPSEARCFRTHDHRGRKDTPESEEVFHRFSACFTMQCARLRSTASRRVMLRHCIHDTRRLAVELHHDQRERVPPASLGGGPRIPEYLTDFLLWHVARRCPDWVTLHLVELQQPVCGLNSHARLVSPPLQPPSGMPADSQGRLNRPNDPA